MCACCGQIIISTFFQIDLGINVVFSSERVIPHEQSSVSEFFIAIWQPPKIS